MMRCYGLQEIGVVCVDDRRWVRYDFMEYFMTKNSWHICISFLEDSRCNLIIRLCTKTKSSLLPCLKYATYYHCRKYILPNGSFITLGTVSNSELKCTHTWQFFTQSDILWKVTVFWASTWNVNERVRSDIQKK